MIARWLLTFVLLVIAVLSSASVEWFEAKRLQTEQITGVYRDHIRELQNMNDTNKWLKNVVIPYFASMPLSKRDAELDMIHFYDQYAQRYNFGVSQFIYYDTSAKMDVSFDFDPKNQDDIDRFLALRYDSGFIQIKEFTTEEGTISGILTIIQPMQGEANASGH